MSEIPRHFPPDREPLAKPAPTASVGERRYTEEELALILNRAAERQEGVQSSAPRYTLADIQEIAAGAGIAPDHVASVAAALRDERTPPGGGVLGAPLRFRFEESIEGEVADDVVGELFDLARRALGEQGHVTEALGTVEWKARDPFGSCYVTVARRGGRTTIGVLSARSDAATVAGTVGGLSAFFGAIGIGMVLVNPVGLAGPLAAIAGVGLATSGAWASMRAAWRRYARRVVGRTESIGSALAAAARNAVEDGRVRSR
ncbi:MAG: hypothetical protein ACJ8AD_18130 [Gemmatimonadaceae bacterium]